MCGRMSGIQNQWSAACHHLEHFDQNFDGDDRTLDNADQKVNEDDEKYRK